MMTHEQREKFSDSYISFFFPFPLDRITHTSFGTLFLPEWIHKLTRRALQTLPLTSPTHTHTHTARALEHTQRPT